MTDEQQEPTREELMERLEGLMAERAAQAEIAEFHRVRNLEVQAEVRNLQAKIHALVQQMESPR